MEAHEERGVHAEVHDEHGLARRVALQRLFEPIHAELDHVVDAHLADEAAKVDLGHVVVLHGAPRVVAPNDAHRPVVEKKVELGVGARVDELHNLVQLVLLAPLGGARDHLPHCFHLELWLCLFVGWIGAGWAGAGKGVWAASCLQHTWCPRRNRRYVLSPHDVSHARPGSEDGAAAMRSLSSLSAAASSRRDLLRHSSPCLCLVGRPAVAAIVRAAAAAGVSCGVEWSGVEWRGGEGSRC